MSQSFTCDECRQPITEVVYELNTRYLPAASTIRSQMHFHWSCMKVKIDRWALLADQPGDTR